MNKYLKFEYWNIGVKVEDEVLPALIVDVTQIAGVPVFEFEVFVHGNILYEPC